MNVAIDLLKENDPVVNLTWANQISEKNPRIAGELTSALNGLKNATTTNNTSDIITKFERINALLGEAVSSRVPKETLNNSTTQALVLANLANEVYFSYGRALGESPSIMSNMAGMAMSEKETSAPMNMSSNMNMGSNNNNNNNNTGVTPKMAMNSGGDSSSAIKNMTEYQTAQALASKAQDVFNKNLKSNAPPILKGANTQIQDYLNRLKAAIDNKVPFMDVMKIVHIDLHPTLITAYNLQLKSTMH